MRRFAPTVAVLVVLGTGCLASSASQSKGTQTGVVRGTLSLVGGPCVCPRPIPHTVFRIFSGLVTRSMRTDSQGRFSVVLPVGGYDLTMGSNTPIAPTRIQVTAGRTTRLPLKIEAM
jgi:hypothetical protein